MKEIKEIIPAIKYDSSEIFKKISDCDALHFKINQLEQQLSDLRSNKLQVINDLSKNIDTFKTILNKFETCYLLIIAYYSNYNHLRLLDFLPVYDNNYSLKQYVNVHSKQFNFKPIIEYELTQFIVNPKVVNEKLLFKPIFSTTNSKTFSFDLKTMIELLTSHTGYFINKEEFNKNYELRRK